ncbi:MAG: ERF family protein [Atopobiaceae bacterium]|nr:ERF family protein [Atopobiaceae bacterium]
MTVLDALVSIQAQLKAPKDQNAGRYRYRNIEDINEAVKPLAAAHGCAVVYSDTFSDGLCVSTCSLMAPDGTISAQGVSIVNAAPKNMSVEQSCGAASSYARKYAACGLFAIDSSENDPDRTNAAPKQKRSQKPQKAAESADALGAAQKRITAVCKRYAELQGIPTAEWYELNIRTRADYANDAETLNRIASELEESL